ncbi:MAG: hypothetical protein AABW54_04075 [Candidatus Micrarchaeota archaeon]
MAFATPSGLKASGTIKEAAPAHKWEHVPMFLPTLTDGKDIVQITTRAKFLKENIGLWKNWHFYKMLAVVLGVIAILWLRVSVYLTIAAAVAAAWSYGEYIKANFTINMILKRRDLLWTK